MNPAQTEIYKQFGSILWPATERLLEAVAIQPGWKCLELGSGAGDIGLELAERVGSEGSVVGIDSDLDLVEYAKASAKFQNLENCLFHRRDVFDIEDFRPFDFIYSRLLLNRLDHPQKLVHRVLNTARSGAVVAIEDMNAAVHAIDPPCESFERLSKLYQDFEFRSGRDPFVGAKLREFFSNDRFEILYDRKTVTEFHGSELGKKLLLNLFKAHRGRWIEAGLIQEEELEQSLDEFEEFTSRENSTTSLSEIGQVWGRVK